MRPGSLLALGLPAVDPSVADVPDDTVNWTDADRVSSATSLPDGRIVVVTRYFVNEPSDPIEGKRERLSLISQDTKPLTLHDPCLSAPPVSARGPKLAFSCFEEMAADNELHTTYVVGTDGKQILAVPHCTKPKWVSDQVISCAEQNVNDDGEMVLKPKRVKVP